MCGVVYIRTITTTDEIFVSFVCGFSKVLPKGTTFKGCLSIPRAELCAAVALVEKVEEIERELKEAGEENFICLPTCYFSDSQDVIDWIANTKDRQKRYVASDEQSVANDEKCVANDNSRVTNDEACVANEGTVSPTLYQNWFSTRSNYFASKLVRSGSALLGGGGADSDQGVY